jgi:glucose/arabinose dehydrogenase
MRRLALAPALALALAGCGGGDEDRADTTATGPARTTPARTAPAPAEDGLARAPGGPRVETIARGLDVPWEIAFLPDGRALVTERGGTVRMLGPDGRLLARPVAVVDVRAEGEGGLLGLAVDPGFARNRFVYLYRTTADDNEVARFRLDGTRLREEATVLEGIPAAAVHDGGRIRFGPDGRLHVSTGEAGQPDLAQDRGSLGGKILTLSPTVLHGRGPGRAQTFSLGHRNPQGLDWEPRTGRLVATEHGPSGGDGPRGFDELNVVRRGANHGWPEVYGEQHGRFAAPVAVFEDAIAPSGGSFVTKPGSAWTGDFLFGTLVGQHVRRIRLRGTEVVSNEPLFQNDYGRIRTVVEGPDGALYALTSNRDGRGVPTDADDRVLRIVPPAG